MMMSFNSRDIVFCTREAVGQLTIDLYADEPTNTSTCIDLDVTLTGDVT